MKISAAPRRKRASRARTQSLKKGARAANVHSRRKASSRPVRIKRVGLQGRKTADLSNGDTADEEGQEEENTNEEDFHSAEEHDSSSNEAEADSGMLARDGAFSNVEQGRANGDHVRLSVAVAVEHRRLMKLHDQVEGVLRRAEAFESHAAQEQARAERWARCHRHGRGAGAEQREAAVAVHDAERELKEVLKRVKSMEEMLGQDESSALQLIASTEEQVRRHLDHALGRVVAAEHTARAERTRAQHFMAAWLVGHNQDQSYIEPI